MEQIAAAADLSVRTFARYFPSKDGVIASLPGVLTAAVDAELRRIPREVPPSERC